MFVIGMVLRSIFLSHLVYTMLSFKDGVTPLILKVLELDAKISASSFCISVDHHF